MKHRKFTTQLDLEAEIIKMRRKLLNERRLAESHQVEMKRWFELANNPSVEIPDGKRKTYRNEGLMERKMMRRNLTLARRIEEDMLPRLGRALAEFRTGVFEFSKDDTSVVLK